VVAPPAPFFGSVQLPAEALIINSGIPPPYLISFRI
jgi:hypothetical protein